MSLGVPRPSPHRLRPEAVWATLLDVASWPSWDSGITKVEGDARDGGKVKVHSEVSPGRAFPVRVGIDVNRREQ